jgi:hypothetical protein
MVDTLPSRTMGGKGLIRRGVHRQHARESNGPIVSDHGDFGRLTVICQAQEGDDSALRKERESNQIAWLMENPSCRQAHEFQVGMKSPACLL